MAEHTAGKLELAGATILWSPEAHEVVGAVGAIRPRYVQYEAVSASSPDFEKACANAERMKACWNACIGITTESLERTTNTHLPDAARPGDESEQSRPGASNNLLVALRETTNMLQACMLITTDDAARATGMERVKANRELLK